VYVPAPHPGHHDAALLAISAGKAVLAEKPSAIDAAQAREMIDAARGAGTFLMEAMWTRFLPHIARVRARDIRRSGAGSGSSWRGAKRYRSGGSV
jgi:predicted dehydrogenase